MLSVKFGPYHPVLENAFVHTIHAIKSEDPLSPIAVIAPTNTMLNQLQRRLAEEENTSFMNISFMNFFVLAKEICKKSKKDVGLVLERPFIYECIIAKLIEQNAANIPFLKNVSSPTTLARSIFKSIQDIANANIDVNDLKTVIYERFLEGHQIQKLSGVIHLLDLFHEKLKTLKISQYSDIYRMATTHVENSLYLKNFTYLLAYGFYDLTGAEQDFFREIFRAFPSTLFLPYEKNKPSFTYVKYFYDSYLSSITTNAEELPTAGNKGFSFLMHPPEPETECPDTENLRIINVSGKRDEIWVVAKEILRLISEGYKISDIGVVARTLDSYIDIINNIFRENCIPFATGELESLEKYPVVKTVKQILLLKRENFYRPLVIEVLASPYFNTDTFDLHGVDPRPDLWDILSRKLVIHSDIQCWLSRLKQLRETPKELNLQKSDFCSVQIPEEQILCLENILQQISTDLGLLPEKATWTQMYEKINHFLKKYIRIPSWSTDQELQQTDERIMEKISQLLESLCILDCLDEEITYNQFIDTFYLACSEEGIPMGMKHKKGVKVMNAMSARGIQFRILFVLGLNEKEFPRTIYEEPFLRDHVRRSVSEILGNFIPEKLRGFDEERLLFYFLLNAAKERLYLLYERTDEEGKPRAPSHYLLDIFQYIRGKERQNDAQYKIYVPRGMKKKLGEQKLSMLTPVEAAIHLALERIDPATFVNTIGINQACFNRAKYALSVRESFLSHLSPYDGVVDDISPWWNKQICKGFSPTMLETFGMCPFRFFVKEILKVGPLDEPEKTEEMPAYILGLILHMILRDFYHFLSERRYFYTKTNERNPSECLSRIAQSTYKKIEQYLPVPYPLLWEVKKEEILTSILNFVKWDINQLEKTGFVPFHLEKGVEFKPQECKLQDGAYIKFFGKIDRIDVKKSGQRIDFRLVDYKSGKINKDNLIKKAINGERLQLPFYIAMAEFLLKKKETQQNEIRMEEASFLYITRETSQTCPQKNSISKKEWAKYQDQFWINVKYLLTTIHKGLFPPKEEKNHCQWCEFDTICRKGHQPSRFRQEKDYRLKK